MMPKSRLEAFSDGVMAIIITIMVLELHVPDGAGLDDLGRAVPALLRYALSFVFIAIYWNNHHHMFQAVDRIDGSVLWANMHLLFWLSLVPFVTGWLGENATGALPTASYGFVLLMAGTAYYLLQRRLIIIGGPASRLATAVGSDLKGKISPVLCMLAIVLAFAARWLADVVFVAVVLMWLIPDRRIERNLAEGS